MSLKHDALDMTIDAIALLTDEPNSVVLFRIKDAFLAFVADFHEIWESRGIGDCWEAFISMLNVEELRGKRRVLAPEDRGRYRDFFQELTFEDHIDSMAQMVSLSQVFDEEDRYVAAWFTCSARGQPFWIVIDDAWQYTVHETPVEVAQKVSELAGDPVWSYSTYGCIGDYPLLYSSKLKGSEEDAAIVQLPTVPVSG